METLLTSHPTQFDVATGDNRLNGTLVEIDPETGLAQSIQRLLVCERDLPALETLASKAC
jgi:calcineurin-like phosphoesterase